LEKVPEPAGPINVRLGGTLDPYLIAEYEQAVLGIWEGDRIIAPAPQ
jgi:hypothetical protein